MSISPFAVGQLLPVMQVQLSYEESVAGTVGTSVDLTGLTYSNFSLNIYNVFTKTDQPGQGVFILVDAPNGVIQYAWNVADTANPGTYQLFISANFVGGPLIFDPIPFVIVPK